MTEKIEDKKGGDIFNNTEDSVESMFDDSGPMLDLVDEIASDAKKAAAEIHKLKKEISGKKMDWRRDSQGFLRDQDGVVLREDVPDKQPVKKGRIYKLKSLEKELADLDIGEKARKEQIRFSQPKWKFWKRLKKIEDNKTYLLAKEVLKNKLFQLEQERGQVTSRYYRNQQEQIDKHGVSRW